MNREATERLADRYLASERLTDRFVIRQAAQSVCGTPAFRNRTSALRDLTPRVMAAFAEGIYLGGHEKVAFGKVWKKLTQLMAAFKKIPKLWDMIKAKLGIESLSDLPRAIAQWVAKGRDYLKRIFEKVFKFPPLSIYTLGPSQKLLLQHWIKSMVDRFPRFKNWLVNTAKPKVDMFEMMLREAFPVISGVVLGGIAFFLWWNVVEFEWNLQDLINYLVDAFTGKITLAELLSNLPGFGLGALFRIFNIGWDNPFALWPPLFVAQIILLLASRYLIWTGKGFKINQEKVTEDFDTAKDTLRSLVPGRDPEVVVGL